MTVRVLAPNPGPMTLDGTNTWVLPGGVVVDPGPADEGHLRAVLDAAGGPDAVRLVLLTHGHADHSEAAGRFSELADAPVRAYDPAFCVRGERLVDGEQLEGLRVLHVPGHTSDSVAFLLDSTGDLLSGDTVLGRGTTVVAYPDGVLAAYLESLRALRDLAAAGVIRRILPGHGPELSEPLSVLEHYLAHRAERLEQVRSALAAGAHTPRDVVERVYADVDRAVWPAAELSVRAQLDYLANPPSV